MPGMIVNRWCACAVGEDALRDALGFCATETVAAESHRVIRRDVHLRDTDAEIAECMGIHNEESEKRGAAKPPPLRSE